MKRNGEMWCWIAVVSMIDKHYHPGNFALQDDIANKLGKGPKDGGYVRISRACVSSGFSNNLSEKPSWETIVAQMKLGRPIAILTESGGNEHYVGLVGCYKDRTGEYVIINETREPGGQVTISYSDFSNKFNTQIGYDLDQKVIGYNLTMASKSKNGDYK